MFTQTYFYHNDWWYHLPKYWSFLLNPSVLECESQPDPTQCNCFKRQPKGLKFLQWQEILLFFSKASRLPLRPTHPPIQWEPRGKYNKGIRFTTLLKPVLRLRISRAIHLLPTFPMCLHGRHRNNFTFTFTMNDSKYINYLEAPEPISEVQQL